jgi:MoxR-like ATPase
MENDLVSAYLAATGKMGPNDSRFGGGDVSDIGHYIKFGALGRAFAAAERHVLLIDEIDKADLEFPNARSSRPEKRSPPGSARW